ncbi:MAG TPA: LLM class flavin-dependent oxidoreductase [Dehalococcoidia bacterium]|nr:LLM class flavin-dependent oxidoreductase [Dehalococcoidia bacterium]
MRFGLFFLMQRDPNWAEQAVYDAELEQMVAAEALGFESVWVAEHHFSDYGLCPAPQVLAAYVAARTRRLRLGMGVSLLPLHDPVKLAEELAVLDQVSGGRLDVGIGRGGAGPDYTAFGAGYEESRARQEEGIALMRACWSGAPVQFSGRFRSLAGVRATPRPRQQPHPPLWLAANSTDSNLSAARLGLPTLSSFFVPASELQRRRAAFREEAAAAGYAPAAVQALHEQSCGMRCVFVARDRAEAIATVRGPFMAYQERLSARANVRGRLGFGYLRPFEQYLEEGLASFGNPDDVVESLQRYAAETDYERVLILMALAGVPGAATLRSMELFAAEVMPRLAGVAA